MMAWWWWWCWWQGLRRRQWWIWWPWQWWWHQRRRWWWRWWRWWWRGRRWWCKARPPRQLPADPPTAKSRTTTISILSQPPPTSFSFLLLFDIFQHFNIFSISTTISTLYTTTNLIFILTFVHFFLNIEVNHILCWASQHQPHFLNVSLTHWPFKTANLRPSNQY